MPYLRHRSFVFAPASPSFNTPMICSSVNRLDFIVRSHLGGLYSVTVLFAGSTSGRPREVLLRRGKAEMSVERVSKRFLGLGQVMVRPEGERRSVCSVLAL